MLSKVITPSNNLVPPALEESPLQQGLWLRRPTIWYGPGKTAIEFCACLVMLILAAPIILVAAVLVKLTSRGPAFYTQTRLGLDGRDYIIYKLRSMFHNCERNSGACWSTAGRSEEHTSELQS